MAKKNKQIVIVGGGFGGVKAALNLANKPGFEVKLISDNTHFEYHGALYRSAVGHSPMEVVIPLREIFADIKNVEVILDSAGMIEADKKRLASVNGNIYSYDVLILALGNTVNYFGIPGLAEHTETMNTISNTIKLRTKMVDLFSQEKQTKPYRITVVGAGASGVELAAEIPEFAKLVAHKYKVKAPKVKVSLVDGAPRVLPMLSEHASKKTAKHLKKLGVDIHLNMKVESCKKEQLCMSTGKLDADIIVWTAGSKPVSFYENNPDVFTLGRAGRVSVDEFLTVQGQEDIYVLGDNADTKFSGMAQTAIYDANFVVRNLLRVQSRKKMVRYRARYPLYVVTAGPKWAVVQQGPRVITGYKGWLVRRRADLWIFRNFQPYMQAVKTWRAAYRMSEL